MDRRETAEAYVLGGIGAVKGLLEVYAVPTARDLRPSTKAWLVLTAGVIAYDMFAKEGETLSEGVDNALEHHKLLTLGVGALVVGHLFNMIKPEHDPIHQLAVSS